MNTRVLCLLLLGCVSGAAARADRYYLLTGVDAGQYPGQDRYIPPYEPPTVTRAVQDGDRLAGTSDVGAVVSYQGTGAPLYAPNYAGSLSLLWRRGHVPWENAPLLGIEFLGGPLLDLDGDLGNGVRSYVPVMRYALIDPLIDPPSVRLLLDVWARSVVDR